MKNLKVILFVILLSGLNCCPVIRDAAIENESRSGKQIHRRSTDDQRCRKTVIIHCELQKKTFPSKNRLSLYEKCLFQGFNQRCG